MNRGSGEQDVLAQDRVDASMRPRFMNRGSMVRVVRRGEPELGFNEAPIHESGKSRPTERTCG